MSHFTVELVRERLTYDPATGVLTWKSGRRAGTKKRDGYRYVDIDRKYCLEHRVIWALHHGRIPEVIDHINGDRADNRIGNLRDVTQTINKQNLKASSVPGKLLGVHRQKRGKFAARISVDGKKCHLGTFASANEAHAVYLEAKRRLHPGNTL